MLSSILGLLFALFLPGLFVTLIFFRELKLLERVILSITFSIMISVAIGISLGYDADVAHITGGITSFNVWKWELITTSVFGFLALAVNRKRLGVFANLKQKCSAAIRKLSKEKEVVSFKKL